MALAFAGVLVAAPAYATSTFCTDAYVRKPGLRAKLWLIPPPAGYLEIERAVSKFAERDLAMLVSAGGGMEDPGETPILRTRDTLLQSPDVSVAIWIQSSNRTDRVYVTVTRTCYNNKIVPWRPYWTALTAFFQRQGYQVAPPPRIDLRKAGFLNRERLRSGP